MLKVALPSVGPFVPITWIVLPVNCTTTLSVVFVFLSSLSVCW